jgi:hypothetical protein
MMRSRSFESGELEPTFWCTRLKAASADAGRTLACNAFGQVTLSC